MSMKIYIIERDNKDLTLHTKYILTQRRLSYDPDGSSNQRKQNGVRAAPTLLPTSSLEETRSSISALSVLLVRSSSSFRPAMASSSRVRARARVSFSRASASARSRSSAYLVEVVFSSASIWEEEEEEEEEEEPGGTLRLSRK